MPPLDDRAILQRFPEARSEKGRAAPSSRKCDIFAVLERRRSEVEATRRFLPAELSGTAVERGWASCGCLEVHWWRRCARASVCPGGV